MALRCPRTGKPLKALQIQGISLDISEGCGGVWLDRYELKKLDEAHESAGDELVAALAPFADSKIDLLARIKCPKCPDVVMMRNFYSPQRSVQIDTCPVCAGIWLDPGELLGVRSLFKTEAERKAYVKKFTDEVAGEGMASVIRFVCPTTLKLRDKGK